jgi:hypothetical protein
VALLRARALSGPLSDVQDDGETGPPELIAHDRVAAEGQHRGLRLELEGDMVDVEPLRIEKDVFRAFSRHEVGRWRDG